MMISADLRSAYAIGNRTLTLSSSSKFVLAACDLILQEQRPQFFSEPDLNVSAIAVRDGWQLQVDGRVVAGLANITPIPLVAERLIGTACSALARVNESILVDGVFLQRDDVTVAIVGDDFESAQVLGLHLQSRGWSLASFRSAFIANDSLDFIGLRATLSLSSSSLEQIPKRFRPAVERSLWYDTGYDIRFYTVETEGSFVFGDSTGPLTHVIIIDGDTEDFPSITGPCSLAQLGPLACHRLVSSLRVSQLTLGSPIASCSSAERWLSGVPA